MHNTSLRSEMSGGATTEQFILRAQKSTNHLKALLSELLPASGGSYGAGAESSVDALLSDITDSLSQAITSLRIPTVGQAATASASTAARRSTAGAGGRRSAPPPRRTSQRASRMDGASRMIVLQNGVHDSYTWRKYGQKEILGARFPRSYFKCGRRPGCPAKKHVQQCDADPSKLEITYFEAHTCDDPPPSSSSFLYSAPDPTTGSDALLVPVTAVQFPSAHCYVGRPSSSPSNVVLNTSTSDLLLPVVAAVVPGAGAGALPPSSRYDPVPDVTDWCSELEQAHDLQLHIPSPACSQSELLLLPELDCDFAVPEL